MTALPLIVALLFFMPIGKTSFLKVGEITSKVDERDTMFARSRLKPGSDRYKQYYEKRPEYESVDEKIRPLPRLLAPGGKYYDPVKSTNIRAMFEIEEKQVDFVDGDSAPEKFVATPEKFSNDLKEITLHLGASEVGIAKLNPMYLYSHVGNGPEDWGSEINNNHPYVIAFTVEMDHQKVEEAPRTGITEETALQYLNAQRISLSLAEHIRGLGYSARAHISGSNYQLMLPPVASDAGLGELGRLGYLVSPKYGARIRLGAVTTDIPIVPDQPLKFGVQEFCEKCLKCAVNCPSGSIPNGPKENIRGVEKWQLHIESCYKYWRIIGTDCGLCMKVCPFSHPDTIIHNLLRQGIKRSSFARTLSLWGDDLFYGKKLDF